MREQHGMLRRSAGERVHGPVLGAARAHADALTWNTTLLALPGSAPRSVIRPSCHEKAWDSAAIVVSDTPITAPAGVIGRPGRATSDWAPPSVPTSVSRCRGCSRWSARADG